MLILRRYSTLFFLVILAIIFALMTSSVLAEGPTMTYVGPFQLSCQNQGIIIETDINGDDGSFNSYYRITADAGGLRYTDGEFAGPRNDGVLYFPVNDAANTVPVTGVFPIPDDTPITIELSITEGSMGRRYTGLLITIDKCNGGMVTSVVELPAEPEQTPACPNPLPSGSVIYSVPLGAPAFYAADFNAQTTFTLPAGTWWISQFSADFAQVWIACEAKTIWIPANAVAR